MFVRGDRPHVAQRYTATGGRVYFTGVKPFTLHQKKVENQQYPIRIHHLVLAQNDIFRTKISIV